MENNTEIKTNKQTKTTMQSRPSFWCRAAPWQHACGCVAPVSPSGHRVPCPQGSQCAASSHPGNITEQSTSFTALMKMWQLLSGSLVPQLSQGRKAAPIAGQLAPIAALTAALPSDHLDSYAVESFSLF